MSKITFMGAGSTVFVKNILGDTLTVPTFSDCEIALYDIDAGRLSESERMINTLNNNINQGKAKVKAYLGVDNRKEALRNADFIVNAIQVGGYEPCTVTDFEIPKKYGLRQTIADTLGIGGIFRTLRTIPVLQDFARDIQDVCPDAWFLNYSNPMAMLTMALNRCGVKTVGLCHSWQGCAEHLINGLGMEVKNLRQKIAGINHQAWLLEVADGKTDLYPEIKRRAAEKLAIARQKGVEKYGDMVRQHLMLYFGYYITESSEHSSEYLPYYIKAMYPQLIEEFNIPLDEYPRRCINQIASWKKRAAELVDNPELSHVRSHEYGSFIMDAIVTGNALCIGGNVMNNGLITNLPAKACVEVPCLVDKNGIQGCYVGDLPEQCAALNRTNINTQILTVEAAFSGKKEDIYHAAALDPHTSAELPLDDIRKLCDDLIAAHGDWLPNYR